MLDTAAVRRIAKVYDPLLFGLGHASHREDGLDYVIDGQHRVAAAIEAGEGHSPVLFKIYRGLSRAQESKLFLDLNANKKAVGSMDMFIQSHRAGHPTYVTIVNILSHYGLEVSRDYKKGSIQAVVALVHVHHGKVWPRPSATAAPDPGREHLLSRTLHVLTSAWKKDRGAFDAILLKGVAAALCKHGARIDGNRLAKSMSKNGTPEETIGRIRVLADIGRKTPIAAAVEILEGLYNRGKMEGNRLS